MTERISKHERESMAITLKPIFATEWTPLLPALVLLKTIHIYGFLVKYDYCFDWE